MDMHNNSLLRIARAVNSERKLILPDAGVNGGNVRAVDAKTALVIVVISVALMAWTIGQIYR